MAARARLASTDPMSPAVVPQRKAAAEAVPHTQQRHDLLAHKKGGKRSRSCISHAVATAPPAQAPEALQLEVCFEAPPENFVPPTRIQTKGRIIASACPEICSISRHVSTSFGSVAAAFQPTSSTVL